MFYSTKKTIKANIIVYAIVAPFLFLSSASYAVNTDQTVTQDTSPKKHEHDDLPRANQGKDKHNNHNDEHDEGPVEIASDIAKQSGIKTATAQPVILEIMTQAFGKLVIPPNQEAHIHARFPGLVKDIRVHVGDHVKKGDVLAVIESNESLQDYTVKAPMSGIVTQRQLNLGEITDDGPLVVIVDTSQLWAELKIFPHQRQLIKQHQTIYLARDDREITTTITHLAPSNNASPYMLARAVVDNVQQQFTPGELMLADIVYEKAEVSVAVENKAIQVVEGQKVVFVKEDNKYERRVVTLGRTDGNVSEVLSGVQAGENYVTDNSYLIKADIEKSGAGHHH